ncbi:hypothetical protein Tco_0605894 [Tanacetum coccineum]
MKMRWILTLRKMKNKETELTYPYKEVNPFNPPPPASESEPEDVIEVENTIEHEDETVPASVHEVGKAKDEYYGKLILDLGNEVRSSVEQGMAAMEKLVEKLGNAKEKAECKKLKKELEEARFKQHIPSTTSKVYTFTLKLLFGRKDQGKCQCWLLLIEAMLDMTNGWKSCIRRSGPARGQDAAPTVRECTFAGFMKCNPTAFHGTEV